LHQPVSANENDCTEGGGGEYSHLGSSLLGCAGCVSAGGNISVLTNEKRPRLLGICRLLPPTV